MESKLNWKMAWKVLNTVEDLNTIEDTLHIMKDDLVQGLTRYKYEMSNFEKYAETIELKSNFEFTEFLTELCSKLNLDLKNTWAIFCNYIMFECYYKMEDMDEILAEPKLTTDLIASIWNFYSLERMYMLRTFEYILRHHIKKTVFLTFVREITYQNIQTSLINQLEYLKSEIFYENTSRCVDLKCWVSRNYSEQIQVLVLITYIIEFCGLDVKGFIKLLKLFQDRCFMYRFKVSRVREISDPSVIKNVRYLEYAVVFAVLKEFWYRNELWSSYFSEIDVVLKGDIYTNPNHVILMAWAVLCHTLPDDDKIVSNNDNFKKCILEAFENNVFVDLKDVAENSVLKGTVGENVVKLGLADFLEVFCVNFTEKKISFEDGVLPLIAELLRSEEIAKEFFDGRRKALTELFNDHVTLFPTEFEPYTMLYEALIDSQYNPEYIFSNLCHIQAFSETTNENCNLQENLVLNSRRKPFGNDLVEFSAGSTILFKRVDNQVYRTTYCSYSYFNVLLHLIDKVLYQFDKFKHCNENEANMLVSGYRFLLKMIKNNYAMLHQLPNVQAILRNIIRLMIIAANFAKDNVKLLSVSLDLVGALFKLYPADICTALTGTPFFPLFYKAVYDEGCLEKYNLLTEFASIHIYTDCQLLIPFIKLVRATVKTGQYQFEMQIRGCNIIIGEWFLKIMDTDFIHDSEMLQIATELVNLIYHVLSKDCSTLSDIDLVIYNSFVSLFINNEKYLAALLKLIEFGSERLDFIYVITPNASNILVLKLLKMAKRSLLCLLFLLGYVLRHGMDKHSMLEDRIYKFDKHALQWQVKHKSTLCNVFGFMRHGMTFEIPKIVCRILTEFVKVSEKPIYQALELSDVIIQDMFLERLRNPLEDNRLKVSIIHLVDACLPYQHCMTRAFFDTSPNGAKSSISMNKFLTDYLQITDSASTSTPMYSAILCLFHSIFKLERCKLVKDVICLDTFWHVITWPLFKSTSIDTELMLQLFEMVIIELFMNNTKSEKFLTIMSQIFDPSGDVTSKCMHSVVALSKCDKIKMVYEKSNCTLNIASVMIWKKFILSVKRFHPEYFDRGSIKLFLTSECFNLLVYFSQQCEPEFMKQWAEVYLSLLSTSPTINICKEDDIYKNIPYILKDLLNGYFTYDDLHKLTILSIFVKLFKKHCYYIMRNRSFIDVFLKHFNWMFFYESNIILGHRVNKMLTQEHIDVWTLIVSIINMCLNEDIVLEFEHYFFYKMRYLELMLEIYTFSLKHLFPVKILHTTGHALMVYSESKIAHHYLLVDLKQFYMYTFPPREYLLCNNNFPTGIIPQHLKDWWVIYPHMVRLNKALLCTLKDKVAEKVILFIDLHEIALCDGIKTAVGIGDYNGTRLAANIIYFLHEALTYIHKWVCISYNSFERIMTCLIEVLNMSITVFLRPDIITFVPNKIYDEENNHSILVKAFEVPNENYIDVVNRFLHLAAWICMFFIKYNPALATMIQGCSLVSFRKFITNDFRVTIMLANMKEITFSTLTCGLHYLCKILTKMTNGTSSLETANQGDYFATPAKYLNVLIMTEDGNSRGIVDLLRPTQEEIEFVPAGPQYEWLFNLDKKTVLLAIEAFSTFIASHSYFAIQDASIPRTVLRYIRRELCEELEMLYEGVSKYLNGQNLSTIPHRDLLSIRNVPFTSFLEDAHGLMPINKLIFNEAFCINVDVKYYCSGDPSGSSQIITNIHDAYLIALVHWFRGHCKLMHYKHFDKFLAKWHGRSTCVSDKETIIKYTSVPFDDDQYDDF